MICRHFSVIPDTIPQLVKCHTVLEHVAALGRTQQLEGRHSEKFNQYKQNPVSCSRDPATPQPIPKLVIVLNMYRFVQIKANNKSCEDNW